MHKYRSLLWLINIIFLIAALVLAAMNNTLLCGILFILSAIVYGIRKLMEQKKFWFWDIIVALVFIGLGIKFLLTP